MFLGAYVDESETISPPVFVLGGYIAPAENWARFSDAWQEVLDMRPPMTSFHMVEVAARGWDDPIFAERLQRFYRVIEENVSAEFSCVVELDIVEKALAKFPFKVFGMTPYRIGFQRLIYWVIKAKSEFGLTGKVDFIFDKHVDSKKVDVEWGKIVENAPDVLSEVAEKPRFLADDDIKPLQAADLHVWWVRKRRLEAKEGSPRLMPPWQEKIIIPGFSLTFGEDDILEILWSMVSLKGNVGFTYG